MGVGSFFRWISTKYPKIMMNVVEDRYETDLTVPNPNQMEFDNLYVDMNGIIHPCSHGAVHPRTEEEMYVYVCKYLDRLVNTVRPRKVLFLAIDGVAPRAKMNQQRTRRFKSAKEAKETYESKQATKEEMQASGKYILPTELDEVWDSNVITPGTEFMEKLSKYIRFFIVDRMNSNPYWSKLKVIFSDEREPGEGEHKIIDFIRRERNEPGYNPNTRHILHGLDADLIMLGLATHEAHFTILRDQVLFGKENRNAGRKFPEQEAYDAIQRAAGKKVAEGGSKEDNEFPYGTPFVMLHIPILREYLRAEFQCLETVPFGFDFERIVDDFVFICFFVGNDFLPHLPSLEIRDGAIELLYNIYKRLLPSMKNYLTSQGGIVNLPQVQEILREIGIVEDEIFRRKRMADESEMKRHARNIKAIEEKHGEGETIEQMAIQASLMQSKLDGTLFSVESREQKIEKLKAKVGLLDEPPSLIKEGESDTKDKRRPNLKPKKRPRKEFEDTGILGDEDMNVDKKTTNDLNVSRDDEDTSPGDKKLKLEHVTDSNKNKIKDEKIKDETTDSLTVKEEANLNMDEEALIGSDNANNVEVEGMVKEESFETMTEDDDLFDKEDEEEEIEVIEDILNAPVKSEVMDNPPSQEDIKVAKEELARRVKQKYEEKLKKIKQEVQDTVRTWEQGYKERYYGDKFKVKSLEMGGGKELMFERYIEGLCWVYQYYYRGCPSWGWFFPFHYAPFASDLVDIEKYPIKFEIGEPLRPLEQLMGVLPPESAEALPPVLGNLMVDEESPIKDFYPTAFPIDPCGKHLPHLHVVLLPFIDEVRLKKKITFKKKSDWMYP